VPAIPANLASVPGPPFLPRQDHTNVNASDVEVFANLTIRGAIVAGKRAVTEGILQRAKAINNLFALTTKLYFQGWYDLIKLATGPVRQDETSHTKLHTGFIRIRRGAA
jgi:hypothetical protein